MLGKLIKNELKSYRFSFGIMFLAGVIFTIFMKIVCMLPYQANARDLIQVIGFYGYYYIIALISVAAQVLIIIRFYSTMVGDRGYLTWTLPVSSATHIWSKLIGGLLWKILAGIVTFILLAVFVAGDYWNGFVEEMAKEFGGMFGEIADAFEPKYIFSIVLGILVFFIWSVFPLLLIFMCIAIGQLFGKWRILASIGCYFIIVVLFQVLSVFGIAIVSIAGVPVLEGDYHWDVSAFATVNIVLAVLILFGAGLCVLQFAITNSIFKKHLNLE